MRRVQSFKRLLTGGTTVVAPPPPPPPPPPPTLGALSFSATSFTVGAVASGTINGATALSTITATGLPTGLTINGAARTWAWDGTGTASSGSFTLTETLAGAVGSPKPTTISYTIAAASGSLSISTAPTLSGDAVVGQTIFATNGTYSATPDSYTPAWSVGGVVQSDQTGTTLLVLDDYAGLAIGYSEIAHKSGYTDSASNAATSTGAVATINLTNAITAFTRTSTSGTVPMTWSATFGSNVYEGYFLRAQVFSDSGLTTQTQDIRHLLTHADLQSGATIDLTSDGLTTIGATSWLELSVFTTSPNGYGYSYAFPTPLSPTDAVPAITWSTTDKNFGQPGSLTNGNLTVNFGSGQNAIRSNRAVNYNKTYWELTGSRKIAAVADATASLTIDWGATADGATPTTHACSLFDVNGGIISYNGSRTAGTTWLTTDTLAVALDSVNGLVWFGKDNGSAIVWMNSGNPAAGTGGQSITGIGSPLYIAVEDFSASITLNAGTTPGGTAGFLRTPPTGFVAP